MWTVEEDAICASKQHIKSLSKPSRLLAVASDIHLPFTRQCSTVFTDSSSISSMIITFRAECGRPILC